VFEDKLRVSFVILTEIDDLENLKDEVANFSPEEFNSNLIMLIHRANRIVKVNISNYS
jgi:hypothetical protein